MLQIINISDWILKKKKTTERKQKENSLFFILFAVQECSRFLLMIRSAKGRKRSRRSVTHDLL